VKKSEMIMMAAEDLTVDAQFICIHLSYIDREETFSIRQDVRSLIKGHDTFATYLEKETGRNFDLLPLKVLEYLLFARRKLCEHLRDRYLAEGD
jgi:hypothetical protein